jgi:hypothetical protein
LSRPASTSVNPPAVPQVTPPLSDLASSVKREEDDSSNALIPLPTNGASHVMTDESHNTSKNAKMQDLVSGVCVYIFTLSLTNYLPPGSDQQNLGNVMPIPKLAAPTSGNPSASATPPIGSLSPSLAPSTAD